MPSTRVLLAFATVAVSACGTGADEESSIHRGDQAFAQAEYEEALAEYRLAVRQGADDAATLARVAHTYAMIDRVDDAGAYYTDAVAADSSYADQAVSDLMRLASEARARNDRFAMASAVELALHHLAWQAVLAVVVFLRPDSLSAWPGWLALVLGGCQTM